jgi:hypothetical protein
MNTERDDGAVWLLGFITAVVAGLIGLGAILFLALHGLVEAARWALS